MNLKSHCATAKAATCLLVLAALFSVGCDSTEPEENVTIEGQWHTLLGTLGAAAGTCCGLDVSLIDDGGQITGSGTVATPSERIGRSYEYAVDVRGTFVDMRVTLNLQSTFQTGQFRGTYYPDRGLGDRGLIQGSFSGFGYRADTLSLSSCCFGDE